VNADLVQQYADIVALLPHVVWVALFCDAPVRHLDLPLSSIIVHLHTTATGRVRDTGGPRLINSTGGLYGVALVVEKIDVRLYVNPGLVQL
jgi:hypothetical protein